MARDRRSQAAATKRNNNWAPASSSGAKPISSIYADVRMD
jgi:hypothetical protein